MTDGTEVITVADAGQAHAIITTLREAQASTTTEATHGETYSTGLHATTTAAIQATSADVGATVPPVPAKAAHAAP